MFTSDSHQPCPRCNEPVRLEAFYCKACGYQLQTPPPVVSEPSAREHKSQLHQPLKGKTLAAVVVLLILSAAYARLVFFASLVLVALLLGQRYVTPLRETLARWPGMQTKLEAHFRPWLLSGVALFGLSTCMLLAQQGHEANVQEEARQQEQAAHDRQQKATQAQAEALQKARQAATAGQHAAAYAAYSEALKHGALAGEDLVVFASSAQTQAQHWRKSGKWDEALQAAQAALKAAPKDQTLQREALEIKALKAYPAEQKPAEFLKAYAELEALVPGYSGLQSQKREAETQQRQAKARAEKERHLAELRGPMPEYSPWDASIKPVKDYLKTVLNDPDSVEYVKWFQVIASTAPDGQDAWGVKVRFRANNAFGAKVLQTWFFYIRHNQVIDASQEPY